MSKHIFKSTVSVEVKQCSSEEAWMVIHIWKSTHGNRCTDFYGPFPERKALNLSYALAHPQEDKR